MPTALNIHQGATFRVVFAWQESDGTPISLAGLSARMQVRARHSEATTLLGLTPGAGLTLEPAGATGEIHVEVGATVTAALRAGSSVFDVEVFDPADADEVTRLVEGTVSVSPEVTR